MTRFLIVAALLIAVPAAGSPGFYAGFSIGDTPEAGTLRSGVESFVHSEGDSWRILAGLEIGPHFRVEVGRHDLGGQICCGENVADLGFDTSVEGFSAAALARLPLNRFSLFAKVGALSWEEEGSILTIVGTADYFENDTDLLVGGGVDIDLVAGFVARVDWERFDLDDVRNDVFWASVLYRF